MLIDILLPGRSCLDVQAITVLPDCIVLDAVATQRTAVCPICRTPAGRVHSRYLRRLADLPLAKTPFRLELTVRRFYCDNLACGRKTFVEQIPAVTTPLARRTPRLAGEQRQIGLDLGGEAGARLARRQGMGTSPDTLLRLVRRNSGREAPTPRILGVDDWAYRKGREYGTILVDLETHQVVDLLPGRTAESLAKWLIEHPGVEIISRDRAGAYADGATRGAPGAIQVADRFHLLQNLREAVEKILDRHVDLREAAAVALAEEPGLFGIVQVEPSGIEQEQPPTAGSESNCTPPPMTEQPATVLESDSITAVPLTRSERLRQETHERRQALYDKIMALHHQGFSIRAIERELGVCRKTIKRYLAVDKCPKIAARRKKPSLLDSYEPYLLQRMATGCTNGMQLWREIDREGYQGCRALVSRWVTQHRPAKPTNMIEPKHRGRKPTPPRKPKAPGLIAARNAVWLIMRDRGELSAREQKALDAMLNIGGEIGQAYTLTRDFIQMVRERQQHALSPWLEVATTSGIPEFGSLATGMKRDRAAIEAALSLPYSNGQVEGQVNRLKLIKRSMYGRAKLDLLRQRVLPP